ncbi:hypothetical protein PHJA_000632800 [Phtheirospermum japonicum]|uniref:Uncharacterized protein n=1 Tax=Phtheirospermum japonicum TaxID=374723 RepID=A0A830BB30_9LAMI|nr:hypothetical protein PHJA_000632800 [Phtheirospermum japonicum]
MPRILCRSPYQLCLMRQLLDSDSWKPLARPQQASASEDRLLLRAHIFARDRLLLRKLEVAALRAARPPSVAKTLKDYVMDVADACGKALLGTLFSFGTKYKESEAAAAEAAAALVVQMSIIDQSKEFQVKSNRVMYFPCSVQ